jgi:hypothetical protein
MKSQKCKVRSSSRNGETVLKASIALLILLCLPLSRVAKVRGEGQALIDSVSTWSLTPKYEGAIKGDVSSTSLNQTFSNALTHKSGMQFFSSMTAGESNYRLQDRRDNNKSWINTLTMHVRPDMKWNTTYSDSRTFNRIISLSGGLQDFIVNTKNADSKLFYSTVLPQNVKFNARTGVALTSSEKSFKVDKSLKGEIGGGFSYAIGDRIQFSSQAAYRSASDRSETAFQSFEGLGEESDSLASEVTILLPQDAQMKVNYLRETKTSKYIDLPRGLYFEQKLDDEDLVRETQLTNADRLSFEATTYPMRNVEVKMYAEHAVDLSDFEVTKKRFSKTIGDRVVGDLSYAYGKNNTVTFKAERSDKLRDLGPQSVSSYEQKEKRTSLSVVHGFTPTFSVTATATASISQLFYVEYDVNPRDRDQLNQSLEFRIRSQPFKKISANVLLAVSGREFVNIDRSLSSDNREEVTYDFRPQFTYKLNDRIEVAQDYGLNIEFTDFVYAENENFLDRNITFVNVVRAKLTAALFTEFRYRLHFHDRGSYLRQSTADERVLRITQEDRKDLIEVRMRYAVNKHLNVVVRQEYGRRKDTIVFSGAESIFPDGQIEGGLEGQYNWGTDNTLNFSLLKVNRFGTFNSRAQNDFWQMKSNIKYAF